jgi:hypothetical protein
MNRDITNKRSLLQNKKYFTDNWQNIQRFLTPRVDDQSEKWKIERKIILIMKNRPCSHWKERKSQAYWLRTQVVAKAIQHFKFSTIFLILFLQIFVVYPYACFSFQSSSCQTPKISVSFLWIKLCTHVYHVRIKT